MAFTSKRGILADSGNVATHGIAIGKHGIIEEAFFQQAYLKS